MTNGKNDGADPVAATAAHRHPGTREALRAAQLELVQGARRELRIVAPVLDAAVFNGSVMTDALVQFLTAHARNRMRVVVEDTEHMLETCVRFVELARRLSDRVNIRRLGEPHHGLREMFMLADDDSCLRQPDITMIDATLDLRSPRATGTLAERFEELWAAAEPVPGLHTFRL